MGLIEFNKLPINTLVGADFQALELNLLRQHVILAVVLHVVELALVALNGGLGLGYFGVLLVSLFALKVITDFVHDGNDCGSKYVFIICHNSYTTVC